MSTLVVYAAPREGEAVHQAHTPGLRVASLELGVGKVASTLSLTYALALRRPEAVLLVGVCGAYPDRHRTPGSPGLAVLDTCVVGSEVLVDEGVQTPAGFLALDTMRLGEIGPFAADVDLSAGIAELLACPIVAGATVSTCAGVDALSQAFAQRSAAQIENMEGAAVAMVCRRFDVRFAQLRVVSNLTGDRERGGWDLEGALARLRAAVERVLAAGVLP